MPASGGFHRAIERSNRWMDIRDAICPELRRCARQPCDAVATDAGPMQCMRQRRAVNMVNLEIDIVL
jgi:hypothetical protein